MEVNDIPTRHAYISLWNLWNLLNKCKVMVDIIIYCYDYEYISRSHQHAFQKTLVMSPHCGMLDFYAKRQCRLHNALICTRPL